MVDNQPSAARHYTVAELVARERAAARAAQRRQPAMLGQAAQPTRRIEPVSPRPAESAPTKSMHVTELLRREGVDYGESTAEVPPALTAQPPREKSTAPSRAGMFGRAAVLFGLTVGGLVGLQSTLASTPDGPTLAESGGSVTAPEGIERTTKATETESGGSGGGAAPTTSADVELQDNATELAPKTQQRNPAGAQAGGSGSAGGGTGDTAPAPTTQNEPAPTTDTTTPRENTADQPQQDSSASGQDSAQQDSQSEGSGSEDGTSGSGDSGSDGDDGNVGGDLLDPVTGAVSGVLDAGTGLLGL